MLSFFSKHLSIVSFILFLNTDQAVKDQIQPCETNTWVRRWSEKYTVIYAITFTKRKGKEKPEV